MRRGALAVVALAAALLVPAGAQAEFPYTGASGDPADYNDLFLDPGEVPTDLEVGEKLEWMYSATPEPGNTLINADPSELNGVRGAHVADDDPAAETAWQRTTGRPDVAIAVLDSGIKWNDAGAMNNIRFKTRISQGEARMPRNDELATPNEPGEDCSGAGPYDNAGWDLNGDGVFNLLDYACDDRVLVDSPNGVGPAGMLEPQDVLIAFSDGIDDDGNGFEDDMVGWDFLDDDNDPYDDVQYGHGTGEAQDSSAEADNGGELGTCPNCMAIHMRVGDSFVADVNRFAAAVLYAVDNEVLVVQEALGTLNNSTLAREAVGYAYRHGVTIIASAADEAAQHNNWPSSMPHVILVNSVTKYDETFTPSPRSYLQFTGCTNFNAKVTVSIPSVSCSSDATGRGSGMAGLIYSAALTAVERDKLEPHPSCTLTFDGDDPGDDPDPCPVTPNEIRQLMASGTIDGTPIADDVDFAGIEGSCSPAPTPGCTDPNLNSTPLPQHVPVVSPVPSKRYPARAGHDAFYGYGRVNMETTISSLLPSPALASSAKTLLPPEVELGSPEWFEMVDPGAETLEVEGEVWARGEQYSCEVQVAPGHYPNNAMADDALSGDFAVVQSGPCDGSARTAVADGVLAELDLAALEARFPPDAGSFDGPEPGSGAGQTANGRPNADPYGFTIRVVATRTQGATELTGEDRRGAYLHRDASMLEGLPLKLTSDGASSPALADLDGDNRNELILATSDGFVHAFSYDPDEGELEELPNWPVQGDVPGIVGEHSGAPAYQDEVSAELGGAFLGSVAVGDMNRDGLPEVYAADLEGGIYGWNPAGERIFEAGSDPDFSGRPLTAFVNEREGVRNRTQHGFLASPVLADLDGNDGGKLELIAAGMDRHVYAFDDDGSPVPGYPVLAVDETKVASVDADSHAVRFRADAGDPQNQGAIVDTPALADISGDERPEIIVGTNEEYIVEDGTEGDHNVGPTSAPALTVLAQTGLLDFANGRLYAIDSDGDPDAPAAGASPFVEGWPVPIGLLFAELLPLVGEGINGSPVVADLNCPSGGSGPKVGVIPAAGVGYVLNADGTSCFGQEGGLDRVLASEFALSAGKTDTPAIPAVGLPAFGDLGGTQPSFLAPTAGVLRALDLAVNEYQVGSQDFIAAWDTTTGQFRPGFPSRVNDLSFLTGPSVADIDELPGEEVIAGTATKDLAAFSAAGTAVPGWPKLTGDWTVTTPMAGSLGTLDTETGAQRVVIAMTRSGYVNAYGTDAGACAPASSPRFHHDIANSGDYGRDAVAPGAPMDVALSGDDSEVTFTAPGDDLLCGTADHYELAGSDQELDENNFERGEEIDFGSAPAEAGETESWEVPAGAERYLGIRAVDEQGNPGRVVSVEVAAPGRPEPPGPGPGSCDDVLRGTAEGDRLRGSSAAEKIRGGPGDDRIRARGGDDCVFGNGGRDRLKGNGGADRINGNKDSDRVAGGGGDDTLRGGAAPDRIAGGGGDDTINVRGGGRDKVSCGRGQDSVKAGRTDRVRRNCERVERR